MIFQIPTLVDVAFWRQRTNLDGTDFLLDFAWNGRANAWFLSILSVDEVPLAQSLKLVCNKRLLRRKKYRGNLPLGEIQASDLTGKIDAPNFEQLGTIVPLIYYDAEELALQGIV